jgi:hypothetical protein
VAVKQCLKTKSVCKKEKQCSQYCVKQCGMRARLCSVCKSDSNRITCQNKLEKYGCLEALCESNEVVVVPTVTHFVWQACVQGIL